MYHSREHNILGKMVLQTSFFEMRGSQPKGDPRTLNIVRRRKKERKKEKPSSETYTTLAFMQVISSVPGRHASPYPPDLGVTPFAPRTRGLTWHWQGKRMRPLAIAGRHPSVPEGEGPRRYVCGTWLGGWGRRESCSGPCLGPRRYRWESKEVIFLGIVESECLILFFFPPPANGGTRKEDPSPFISPI
jgi:hypothetical protein